MITHAVDLTHGVVTAAAGVTTDAGDDTATTVTSSHGHTALAPIDRYVVMGQSAGRCHASYSVG